MATATEESRAAGQRRPRARAGRAPESMQFVMFEDNGGAFHWRLVAGDGAALALSGNFASYDDALHAARHVRDGAASAGLDAGELSPEDLGPRRGEPSENRDAERWVDEGGRVAVSLPVRDRGGRS